MPAVQLETATAYLQPTNLQILFSNSLILGPWVKCPLLKVLTTASTSLEDKLCLPYGINF